MRFMMLVILSPNDPSESGALPPPELFSEMMKYNKSLSEAGMLISLDGLLPTSKGARVSFSGAESSVTDGPFTEAKEIVGGYWLINAGSKEEAIEWARRAPFNEGKIEIRQVFEMTDFPAEVQEEWQPDLHAN